MERPTILLVADHASTRKRVRTALELAGHPVHEASESHTAVALMGSERPQIVIQDLRMPEGEGPPLAGRLRAAAGERPVRLLGIVGPLAHVTARSLGLDALIEKPVEQRRLVAVVERQAALLARGADASQPGPEPAVPSGAETAAELCILSSLTTALLDRMEPEEALARALADCFDAIDCPLGALYLLERHGGLRSRRFGRALEQPELAMPFGGEPWLRDAIARGERVQIARGICGDERLVSGLERAGMGCGVVVPLTHGASPLGALFMAYECAVAPDEREALSAFAERLGARAGQALALAAAHHDKEVAAREAEQQRLLARDQAAMWRTLFEDAPDAVMHVDADGRVRFSNRALQVEDARTWFDLVSPEYHPVLRAALEAVEREGSTLTLETSAIDEDGRVSWTESHLGPVRVGGVVQGALVIQRDVTQKKQTEAHLLVADRMASIGTLAASVAHEINNPLSSVTANLELALGELRTLALPPQSELAEVLGDAREAAERVRRIVQDLRIFSSGERPVRRPIDLQALLESALRLTRTEIHTRARLVKRLDRVPPVEANEAELGQVFLNLVVSATQSIEPGAPARNELEVTLSTDGESKVVVSIRDTGSGTQRPALARSLAPFWTAEAMGIGSGLGLAICRRIVSSVGGTLELETEPGRGTLARVTLPCAPRGALPRPSRPHRPSLRRGRVLVLDDEPLVSEVVRRTLAAEHEVLALADAEAALRAIRQGDRFDVLLCDLFMPRMSGMEFYAELMRVCTEQAARVVFFTGGAFTPEARRFLERLPNERLHKPIDGDALRSVVNEMVR